MSDSAGSGESGGVAGAGQDAEADSEPPHQAPPLPEGDCLGKTPEEEAPPSAKRPRLIEEEQGLEQVAEPVRMHGETPAQADLLQEYTAPPATSKVATFSNIRKGISLFIQVKSLDVCQRLTS